MESPQNKNRQQKYFRKINKNSDPGIEIARAVAGIIKNYPSYRERKDKKKCTPEIFD